MTMVASVVGGTDDTVVSSNDDGLLSFDDAGGDVLWVGRRPLACARSLRSL